MKKNVVQIFSGSFGIKKAPIYRCFSERRRGDLNSFPINPCKSIKCVICLIKSIKIYVIYQLGYMYYLYHITGINNFFRHGICHDAH